MSEDFQTGDRVSMLGTVGSVIDGHIYIALDGEDGGSTGSVCVIPAALTLIERPKPPESWQPGDVVRNADNPEDKRVWVYAGDDMGWMPLDEMPDNLTLLVRDGQPVPQPDPVLSAFMEGAAQCVAGRHPQRGDVINDEPPVGSVVTDAKGFRWNRTSRVHYPWTFNGTLYRSWSGLRADGDLTLASWGSA